MRAMSVFGIVLLGSMTAGQASGAMLLTSTNEAQLEIWLGQGDLDFTNIFTKTTGDGQDSVDFHAAADGMGPTFVLIEVRDYLMFPDYRSTIVGGYNPLSWQISGNYIGNWNFTPNDADRTAFIFNLTTPELRRQRLSTDDPYGYGQSQTYNSLYYGPMFGDYDIYVDSVLEHGYLYGRSYGTSNISLVGGFYDYRDYGRIEVYTFAAVDTAPSSVPEPSSCLMAGLAGLGLVVRRRSRRARFAA